MKKGLILVLVLSMILSAFSMSVYAEENVNVDILGASTGTCGKNLTWSLNNSGVLTISGTGEMNNQDFSPAAPWYSYRDEIFSVVIKEGVASIADYAFEYCEYIETITIPSTVKSLGVNPFNSCDSLLSIDVSAKNNVYKSSDGVLYKKDGTSLIRYPSCKTDTTYQVPDTVTRIEDGAFSECENLEHVVLSQNLEYLGEEAFYYCTSLESINIPDKVTEIKYMAFSCCDYLESVIIPDSVKTIGNYAFEYCGSLTTVSIPLSVTSIGKKAFIGNYSLMSVTIPPSVVSIGERAFGYGNSYSEAIMKDFKIKGAAGSEAQKYATTNGAEFVTIDRIDYSNDEFYMDITTNTMPNIAVDTKVSDVLSYLKEYGITATASDKNGKALEINANVGTGDVVRTANYEFVIVVKGDVDGNGKINSTDYLQIKNAMTGKTSLENAYLFAADTDDNDKITSTDYLSVKGYLTGLSDLFA
jgi:hypothetical protein